MATFTQATQLPALAKLELRRRELAMGRKILARKAGVSLRAIDGILTGTERNPRLSTLHAIAKALGVCVNVGAEVGVTAVIDFKI